MLSHTQNLLEFTIYSARRGEILILRAHWRAPVQLRASHGKSFLQRGFVKVVNSLQPLIIFARSFILDV